MIPDAVVEEVRARADIVDIVGEHVSLKRSGKDYKASCPFHDERTPSFYVVPSKGFYNCFGCGESGDVFSFVMKRLGLDFVEAVKHVGQRSGVEVREVKRGSDDEDRFRPLYEAMAFARDFYRERLWEWDGGQGARDYLETRGIDRETAERFGLGYAPDEWRALRDATARHGIDDDVLMEVGLLGESERSDEPYDRFRNRIVFPIEVPGGKVVAFGGRILGESGPGAPKYLNSPETPLYHKGRVLYGLSWSKNEIRREEAALVVEGYMDLVSVAAAGVENVVATLGTSMTEDHAELLSRYTTRVLLLFDSDAAGLRATFRAADTLLGAGLHPAVVTLPDGEDPDTLVRKEGAEGLRGYLEQAVDVLDRKLQLLEEHDYFSSIEKTRDAVDRLLPTLRAAADPALRDIYVTKVAERTGVRRETLEAEMTRAAQRAARRSATPARPSPRRRDRGSKPLGMGAERKLLLLLVKDRRWVERAAERLGPEEFSDASYREIFEALVADPELDHPPATMDPVAARRLEELLASEEELSHAGQVFDESVGRIRSGPLERRAEELRALLRKESSEERRAEILEELQSLARERRSALKDWRSAARSRPDPERGEGEPSAEKSVP